MMVELAGLTALFLLVAALYVVMVVRGVDSRTGFGDPRFQRPFLR